MPWLVPSIFSCLPPGWHPHESLEVERLYSFVINDMPGRRGMTRFHLLYGNHQTLARTCHEVELLEAFESDVNSYVAQTCRTKFFVHAGVVEWKGNAIVIPGASRSGKTTLVNEFLRHGASYCSDEFAIFDSRGYVLPFARPLLIRHGNGRERTRVRAEEVGSATVAHSLSVSLLLFTKYQQRAEWKPRVMSAGAAAIGLLANSVAARRQPERALTILAKVSQRAVSLSGPRGEAVAVVEAVLSRW